MIFIANREKTQGKISLVILLMVGIFFLTPLHAAVTENISVTANQYSVSSFSFNISPLSERKYVFPESVSFDTTGRMTTVTPISAYTGDYIPWDSGYPVNAWTRIINNKTQSTTRNNFVQACQFPYDYSVASLRNKFLVVGMTVSPAKLIYGISNTPADFVDCYSGNVSDYSCSAKAFATVISSERAYCFWSYKPTSTTTDLMMNSFNGSSWTTGTTISNSRVAENYGISGCLMKHNDDEYIVVAFPTSGNEISILAFKSGKTPSVSDITAGITVSNAINGAQITVTQNPRSGKVYLGWISGNKAFYKIGSFNPSASKKFSFEGFETELCSVNDSKATYACISAGSYNNFETSFTVSDDQSIRNFCLCGDRPPVVQTLITESGSSSFLKYATAFQYFENDHYYSGCFCSSGFKTINFYRRQLEYPQACSWQAENKKLHIEGPPRLNTDVTIQVRFAEMVPSETFAKCVNSEYVGGVRAFNSNYEVLDNKAVVASASQCFFAVGFDKVMNVASYPGELSSCIKLTELGNNTSVSLAYVASNSGKLVFKPTKDLKLNSSYIINIASGVIDAAGTQIYKDEILKFKTQFMSTPLDADGVMDIEAFSESSYTNAIASGSDVKANQKLYLRVKGYDPAFNTIDTTTVEVKKGTSLLTTITLKQKTADSQYFFGEYQLSAPLDSDSDWSFQTVNSKKYLPLKVTYPDFMPLFPASGSVNVNPSSISRIEIQASEDLDSSSVNQTNVRLLLLTSVVSANISYDTANKKILIVPASSLNSESNYHVIVENILDKAGNKQLEPIIYRFSTSDTTAPTVVESFPVDNAVNVGINHIPYIVFSEEIKPSTVNKTSVKLTCNGVACDYSLNLEHNKIIINPADGMKTNSVYRIDITTDITDFSENHIPSAYSSRFTTQPQHTPPVSINSITLYKDSYYSDAYGNSEKVSADKTVYIKINAVDGATQTVDVATVSLSLNGAANRNIILSETASDSAGIFVGKINLSDLNLYGYPTPEPLNNSYLIALSSTQTPSVKAELKTVFPSLINSELETILGISPVNGAVGVYVNSKIELIFSDVIKTSSINSVSLKLASGSINIPVTWEFSNNNKNIIITPSNELPYNSVISLMLSYAENGVKDETGNPIKGNINLSFATQKENTLPTTISAVNLYSESSYSELSKLPNNADFYKNGEVFIEVVADDGSKNTVDTVNVIVGSGSFELADITLTETGKNTGIFRGSYHCSFIEDCVLNFKSKEDYSKNTNLKLTTPVFSVVPADGATGVSIARVISILFSEPLDIETINGSNIKLRVKSTQQLVETSLKYLEETNEIQISHVSNLITNKEYEVIVNDVADKSGNKINAYISTFTTQDSSNEITTINSLEVFSNADYSGSALASGTLIPPGGSVWVRVTGEADSFYDYTEDYVLIDVRDFSTTIPTPNYVKLVETGLTTKEFKGRVNLPTAENAYVEVYSTADTDKKIGLKTANYPVVESFIPASGSLNLYLDDKIVIQTNKSIDVSTVNKGSIVLTSTKELNYSVSKTDDKEITITFADASENDTIYVKLTNSLKDSSGLAFPGTVAEYTTKKLEITSFDLYSDSAYTSQIQSGSDVEIGQTIYCKIAGTDLKTVIDTLSMNYTVSGNSNDFVLTEESAGIYKGQFVVPDFPNKMLTVTPVGFTEKSLNLTIKEAFALISYTPEDGANSVPQDFWPIWSFNRVIPLSQLTSSNFKVTVFSSGTTVDGELSLGNSGKQVRFQPSTIFNTSTKYKLVVSADLKDENGKSLGADVTSTFTTQAPPSPPNIVFSFANFADENYNTETSSVAPDGNLYLQLVAEDTSFSTYESARVNIDSSDGTYEGLSVKLIETNPPSGIFRLKVPVSLHEGAVITITPQADSDKKILVTVNNLTKLVSLIPASGSAEVYLDSKIEMAFSKAIKSSSMPSAIKIKNAAGDEISFGYTFADSGKKLVITPGALWEAGKTYSVTANNLKDITDYSIPGFTYSFSTRSLVVDNFELYSDIGYTKKLANNQDIEPSAVVYCDIVATDLSSGLNDKLDVIYSAVGDEKVFSVTEIEAGHYRGSFTVPASINTLLKIFPKNFEEKAIILDILSAFTLDNTNPVDGATNVATDIWPTWSFSRVISASQLTSDNFAILDLSDNKISGTITLSQSGKQVRFLPDVAFTTLTKYKMFLSRNLQDSKGKKLGVDYIYTFTTQPPPPPPTNLLSFKNYVNSNYSQVSTTVIANGKLFMEINAENTDPAALETVHVILDSDDGKYEGKVIDLVETGINTGVFRGNFTIGNLETGTKLKLIPQAKTSLAIDVIVCDATRLLAAEPASGSLDLYLDSDFVLYFSDAIKTDNLPQCIEIKDSNSVKVSYGYSLSADKKALTITPDNLLKPGETYTVTSNNELVDTLLRSISPFSINFSTRFEKDVCLELFTGIAPCNGHKVTETSEITKGELGIRVTTSDMLEKSIENRILRLSDINYSVDIALTETALNSNLYLATTTIDDHFMSPPMKAELIFGQKNQLKFDLATTTRIISLKPSENGKMAENANVEAIFSRKIYSNSAKKSTKIITEGGSSIACDLLTSEKESTEIVWKPKNRLSAGYAHKLNISGLKDYLGLSVASISHRFFVGDEQNINLYSDSAYTEKITTKEISYSEIYVEVVASSSVGLNDKNLYLDLVRGTMATNTTRLKLSPVDGSNRNFRCSLKLAKTESAGIPGYYLGLYPGEWVKLTSPILTSKEIVFYYRFSSGVEPQNIKDVRLFSDKNFIRKVTDEINNPSLYIEIEAEDMNWLTEDVTRVRVTSDDDKTGFVVELAENGTHSDLFRGMITLSEKASEPAAKVLKVSYGKKINIVSETDRNIRASVRYFPKAEIINFTPYPSPARGNHINFRYFLNFATGIRITIFDVAGHKIDTIEMDGREGENIVRWNFPKKMANGTYIYRVKSLGTGDFYTHAKMVKGKFAVLK